ncbi:MULTISPECIES: DUF5994 family protein [unclassified Streptomyces]|uniref:DUF5994 family protein n=1 Tax=unclassified Streptomyces TaxID=2593676 RepID=UPI0013BCD257|nr:MULTISPECIES: DUF5994 family protein [unclassified Streptomyces]NEB34631.1 hypothetical protein [Streptomyces sp. SID14446]WSK59034.1 DUF5994 family protein [Streptomyces sp. NBC_01281]
MSTTTDQPPPRAVPFRSPTTRLALKPVAPSPTAGPAGLDGAWWPRSRDLAHELTALADVLDPLWGRITRIAVNPLQWPIIPRRIMVNGHVVKVDWFTSPFEQHKILLLSYTAGRWDLLVIPPETDAVAAARLMTAATAVSVPAPTASDLMAVDGEGRPSPSHGYDEGRPAPLVAGR